MMIVYYFAGVILLWCFVNIMQLRNQVDEQEKAIQSLYRVIAYPVQNFETQTFRVIDGGKK